MACAVEDLLSAGSAWCGDVCGDAVGDALEGFTDGWEEEHLADGEGSLVVFFLISEGTCHSAT